jgi:predicted PurR-regulated permease PerM
MTPSPPWSGRTKTIVLVAIAIVLAGFLAFISQSFTRILIAGLLAFVASYPIRGLDKLGLRHSASVLVAYVGVIAISLAIAVFGIPALIRSLAEIDWEEIIDAIAEWIVGFLESIRVVVVFGTTYDFSAVIDPVIEFLEEAEPGSAVEVDLERLLSLLSSGAGILVGLASIIVGFVVEFFTILV